MMQYKKKMDVINDDDIYFAKLYKSVRIFAAKVLQIMCKDLYYDHEYSKKGENDINSVCKEVTKRTSRKEFGKLFPSDFKFVYDGTADQGLDTKSSCGLFHMLKIKNPLFNTDLGTDLVDGVNAVQKIRNKLGHSFGYDEKTLEEFKSELIEGLEKICMTMDKILKVEFKRSTKSTDFSNYAALNKATVKGITQLCNSNLIGNERRKLLNMGNDDQFKLFLKSCRQNCAEVYKKLISTPTFLLQDDCFSFPVESVFEPMPLYINNEKQNYEDLFKTVCKNQTDPPTVILLSGDAGNGKTTLCKKYTAIWSMYLHPNKKRKENINIPLLKQFDLVILVEMRKTPENSLPEYLKINLLPNSMQTTSGDDIYASLNQLNVLIILDAFDERSKEANKLVQEMLTRLPNAKYLITTRPHKVEEVANILKNKKLNYLHVMLKGFEEKGMKSYVDQIWNNLKADCGNKEGFILYLEGLSTDFHELVKVPLMTLLLIYLWVTNKEKEKPLQAITFTNLYSQVIELQKTSIVKKIKQDFQEYESYEQFEEMVEKLINIVAEQFFIRKTNEINREFIFIVKKELENYLSKNMISSVDKSDKYLKVFLSTLFLSIPCIQKDSKYLEDNYDYLHKTQLEYLVAHHIVKSNKNLKNLEEFADGTKVRDNIGILKFVVGFIDANDKSLNGYVPKLAEILKELTLDTVFLWKLLSETLTKSEADNKLKVNAEFLKCVTKLLNCHSHWDLEKENLISGFKLLCYAPDVKVESIRIIIDITVQPSHIPRLKETLMEMSEIKKKKKIDVEIRLKKHEEIQSEPSDFILSQLISWANITKFSGHLEEQGIQIIGGCKNLKDLRIKIAKCDHIKLLATSLQLLKKLKKLYIIFDQPFPEGDVENICALPINTADVCVHFNSIEKEDQLIAIKMLKKLNSKGTYFYSVYVTSDIDLAGLRNWAKEAKKFVAKELYVKSMHDFDDEDLRQLEVVLMLNFRIKLE